MNDVSTKNELPFKNKVFMICLALSLLYFLSGFFNVLEIAVAIGVIVCFIILPINASFCLFLFMHNFTLSNISNNVGFTIIFVAFVVIMLAKYIIGVVKSNYKVYPKIIVLLSVVLVFSLITSIAKPMYSGAIIYILYFPLTYLCLALKNEFNIKQVIDYMFMGLVLSCGLAVLGNVLPMYGYAYGFDRFLAFSNNPNYLYMRALFIITYYMYLVLSYQVSFRYFSVVYVLCSIITLSTLSKTGIFLLALFSLIFMIVYLKQDFKSRYKICLSFLVCIALFMLICNKWVAEILDRFSSSFTSGNFWNSILTDRDNIWKDYLINTFNSPITALFGNGLITEQPLIISQQTTRASHNLYIFLLYRFGIIGCILIGVTVYAIIKHLINNSTQGNILTLKPSFLSSLPLIWYLLESLCDNTFYSFNFMYLILAIIIMFSLKPAEVKIYKKKK